MADGNCVNSIFELFVREGADDFNRDDLEGYLRISIRISSDFYDFLTKWVDSPPDDEIDSIVKTINSGAEIHGFFDVVDLLACLDTSRSAHSFTWSISSEYSAIRQAYLRLFHELTSADLQFPERLDCLLVLCEVQLLFLAINLHRKAGM
jgi:hypothetical protein